jgi:hypothetical protein
MDGNPVFCPECENEDESGVIVTSVGRLLFSATTGFVVVLCAQSALLGQAARVAAPPKEITVSVPFVGCSSSGQVVELAAPKGGTPSLQIGPSDAQALAYYKSADGLAILAPRGWYCEGASGSGGFALFLSPDPHVSARFGLGGPAIEINHVTSENSGRFEVAEIMARVFPAYKAFASEVLKGMDFPIPAGPYPKDSLVFRGKTIVEYNTPAQTDGLGNFHSWLGKNDLPIRGMAIIVDDPQNGDRGPDLVLLSVRVPPRLTGLIPAIVSQVERETRGGRR